MGCALDAWPYGACSMVMCTCCIPSPLVRKAVCVVLQRRVGWLDVPYHQLGVIIPARSFSSAEADAVWGRSSSRRSLRCSTQHWACHARLHGGRSAWRRAAPLVTSCKRWPQRAAASGGCDGCLVPGGRCLVAAIVTVPVQCLQLTATRAAGAAGGLGQRRPRAWAAWAARHACMHGWPGAREELQAPCSACSMDAASVPRWRSGCMLTHMHGWER